ncbi:MAG: metallophosphoesterase family protein [Acidobacteria bacterium]|nr:metallophosphoesterase family protein [Acidobacteriota bacterium]
MRIGILSDTHGLLRPQVLRRLAGSDRILHAGDIGDVGILRRLEAIAPVIAVRGNTDGGNALANLPHSVEGDLDGLPFAMVHRREEVPERWLREGPRLVVFGHSHRPELEWRGSCLLLNPGACGQRRFRLPLTVATVTLLDGNRLVPEIYAVEEA